jgi:hypothetical protein
MLKVMIGKRLQILFLMMILTTFMIVSSAFAVTQFIDKDKGGIVTIDNGISLTIIPKSLNKDTLISATVANEGNRLYLYFGPDDTVFAKNKPAILFITNNAINRYNLDDLVLHGENGEILRSYDTNWGRAWLIPHFSLYYFVRR